MIWLALPVESYLGFELHKLFRLRSLQYLDSYTFINLDYCKTLMTRQIQKLSLKQIALIDRAVSDRLSAIAENTER